MVLIKTIKVGVITGVYIAQEYPKDVPRVSTTVKKIVDNLKDDKNSTN